MIRSGLAWGLTAVVLLGMAPAAGAENPPPFVLTWGSYGTSLGQFRTPTGVAVAPTGHIYVTQVGTPCRITKFNPDGTWVTAWGGCGTGDGEFDGPSDLAVDAVGNVYVVDRINFRIQKFTSNGSFITKWGVNGAGNGEFRFPSAVEVDQNGYVYVTDRDNHRVQKFTGTGSYVAQWGSYGTGNGQFNQPVGLGVDSQGNVFVSDTGNKRVQKFSSTGTYLGKLDAQGTGPGQISTPGDITFDGADNMVLVDSGNHRVQRFTGNFSFLSMWGGFGSANGQFFSPWGAAVDQDGYIYIVDTNNHRVQKFGPVSGGGPGGGGNTPAGTNVLVSLSSETDVTYDQVVSSGQTSLQVMATGPNPPAGFVTVPSSAYYELETTAGYEGDIEIAIGYNPQDVQGSETALRLFHYDDSLVPPRWVDVTSGLATGPNVIRGITQSLSTFIVAEPGSQTGIGDDPADLSVRLLPAVPNPFRSQTQIRFELEEAAPVRITVFDAQGRIVRRLLDGATLGAGPHVQSWDGVGEDGSRLAPGMYFVRMETPQVTKSQKVLRVD